MKIVYERDPGTGRYLLQWGMSESIGRDFFAFLTENGRHAVVSPPFGKYSKKGWLSLSETELMNIKGKGLDAKDARTLEFQELLPGKRAGETFTASFGSIITKVDICTFVIDPDPIIARKQAGDILDEKARNMATAESISYAAAFNRACRENPAIYQQYCG